MTTDRTTSARALAAGRSLLDMFLASGTVLGAYLLWTASAGWAGPLRVPVGTAAVLLVPGYTLTAAIFPGAREPTDGRAAADALAPPERVTLSVGLSVLVVPLLAFLLHFSPWGVSQPSVLRSLVGFTLLAGVGATVRRLLLPPERRFRLRLGRVRDWLGGTQADGSRYHLLVAALFVLSVGVAGGAVATTAPGETFTELYLLAEDEESGDLVADGYPTTIAPTDSETVHVGVENREARPMTYTVVVAWQTFGTVDGERTVIARSLLDRYRLSLAPGASNRTAQSLTPPASAAGREVRLTVALYTGDVGASSLPPDSYRRVHIWVTVPDGGGE